MHGHTHTLTQHTNKHTHTHTHTHHTHTHTHIHPHTYTPRQMRNMPLKMKPIWKVWCNVGSDSPMYAKIACYIESVCS